MLATILKSLILLGGIYLWPFFKKTFHKNLKKIPLDVNCFFIVPCAVLWLLFPGESFYGCGLGVLTAGIMVAWVLQTSVLKKPQKVGALVGICFIATFFLPHEIGFFYRLFITLMWGTIVGLFLLLYRIPKLLPFMTGTLFLTFVLFQSFPFHKFYEVFPLGGIGWFGLIALCAFAPLITKESLTPVWAGFIGFCYGYTLMVFAAYHWLFFVAGATSYAWVEVITLCITTFAAVHRFYPWTGLSVTERLLARDPKANRHLFYNLGLLSFTALGFQYTQTPLFYAVFALVLFSVMVSCALPKSRRPSYKDVLSDTKMGLKTLWQDLKGQITQLNPEKAPVPKKTKPRKKK